MFKKVLVAVALVAAAVALAPPAVADDLAYVRAVHLVPGLGSMEIRVAPEGGSSISVDPGLGYGEATDYVGLPAGTYTFSVIDPASGSDAPVVSGTLAVDAGRAYTVAARGTTSDAEIVALPDDTSLPPNGEARVRLINATEGAPLDVTRDDGVSLATDLSFATATGYGDVPAQRWGITATPEDGAASVASIELEPNTTYTLLLVGDNQRPFGIVPLVDASGASVVPSGSVPAGSTTPPLAVAGWLAVGALAATGLWLTAARRA